MIENVDMAFHDVEVRLSDLLFRVLIHVQLVSLNHPCDNRLFDMVFLKLITRLISLFHLFFFILRFFLKLNASIHKSVLSVLVLFNRLLSNDFSSKDQSILVLLLISISVSMMIEVNNPFLSFD